MKDYRAKLNSDQEISPILCECRELMTDHLKHSLPNLMDEVDDVLLDIALKTTDSQERTKYFNAMNEVRLKRHDIERKCLENFAGLFNEKIRSNHTASNECEEPKDKKAITMSNAVNKIRNDCHLALLNLDECMGKILHTGKADVISNPVSPEVVCTAFYNACELADTGTEIRLIIFKYFERYVTSMLNDVYSEITDFIKSGSTTNESISKNQTTATDNVDGKDYQSIADIKQTVTAEIEHLLTDEHVPSFVSDFILNHWVKLLARIYDKNGVNSDAWQHAIDTVEDLVWSVGSISSKQDREKFDELWPDLIMRIRNGINMISMSSPDATDFMSNLFKHRATLSMLRALSKTKNSDVNLINPEKIKALKMKVKQANEISEAKKMELEKLGTEDITIPVLDKLSYMRPFMEELLVDNRDIEGFNSDIDES